MLQTQPSDNGHTTGRTLALPESGGFTNLEGRSLSVLRFNLLQHNLNAHQNQTPIQFLVHGLVHDIHYPPLVPRGRRGLMASANMDSGAPKQDTYNFVSAATLCVC
jgi:hypothetical protein